MAITVLAGGYGGARFVQGLQSAHGGSAADGIVVVGNTADDLILHGLNISPDLDTIMYTLGGGLDLQRGWGRERETFQANEELAAYGVPGTWFGLGDRDLATHLVRTQMLAHGYSLTHVTAALCARWQPGVSLLPMSDDRVETHVVIADDEGRRAVHFQEWWIRHRAEPAVERFVQVGAEAARPGPEVVPAIMSADVVLLAPSNPVVSIGAILSIPAIRAAVQQTTAPVVGVSPIIAGSAVRGMAGQCLAAIGVACDAAAVAHHFGARADGGLLDAWLVDESDGAAAAALDDVGVRSAAVPLLMSNRDATARMAEAALLLAESVQR